MVTATIMDDEAVAAADVLWRRSGDAEFVRVAMAEENGIYSGEIPGQPAGSVLEYYVEAADDSGNRGTEPQSAPATLFWFWVLEHIVTNPIAFCSSRNGSLDIYTMQADGSNLVQLTHNPSSEWSLDWSPDGRRIAFCSDRDGNDEIYVMEADGSNVVRLTHNNFSDCDPAWSPDGRWIAFFSERDQDEEIYVMEADGSNLVQLTHNSTHDRSPDWSPDGSRIAFSSNRDGDEEIYVMEADGSDLVQLTDNTAMDRWPDWSPDGSRIAFSSNRDGDDEIYVMQGDGSDLVQLTDNTAWDGESDWSPDGSRIVFSTLRDDNYEIYVMEAQGTRSRRLTQNWIYDWKPVWSPVPAVPVDSCVRETAELGLPQRHALEQNHPNPFNPETVITYTLPSSEVVQLSIYDLAGQRVRVLVQRGQSAGHHQVVWNGKNDIGGDVASGVYVYMLRTGGTFRAGRRMVVVK